MVKKLLHIPFTWFPAACGGTEVYVKALMKELAVVGWENQVVVPATASGEELQADGVKVHRLAFGTEVSQEVMWGAGDAATAAAFGEILGRERPDLVHFHAFTPAISVRWLAAARAMGIPCVYTYHTPTLTCLRGTLMRGGSPCDGEMTPLRCSACVLHGHGLPWAFSWAAAVFSPLTWGLSQRVPFRILPLIRQRQQAAREWLQGMDCVVALCAWGAQVLRRNGVPEQTLRVIRHGLPVQAASAAVKAASASSWERGQSLKLGFLGRLDPNKGLQVLVESLKALPTGLKLELHCHLIADEAAKAAMPELWRALQADSRVVVHPPVPSEQVVEVMAGYDAVAVPSVWLETGPLVVLEAFAAGVPVLGSDLGGIAEWVRDGVNGLLLPAGDTGAWASALRRLVEDQGLLQRLRAGVQAPPGMDEVARRQHEVYLELITN